MITDEVTIRSNGTYHEFVEAEAGLAGALRAFVVGNVENLTVRHDLLEAPTARSVDVPYGARVIRWSWSYEGSPASFFALYVLPAAGASMGAHVCLPPDSRSRIRRHLPGDGVIV